MIFKLLTEHRLEFLSLKGGCRGSSESTLVKMSNCWKSHAVAQLCLFYILLSCGIFLFTDYKPALEGRSIINLQMSDTFAAYQDISAAIKVSPTAELLTNRGVIYQVSITLLGSYKSQPHSRITHK